MVDYALRRLRRKHLFWEKIRHFCFIKPLMVQNLFNIEPLIRISHKYFLYKIFCRIAKLRWDLKLTIENFFVCVIHRLAFKWWNTNKHLIHYDSNRPGIYFIWVPLICINNLWGHTIRSPAKWSFYLTMELNLSCESEITNFDSHFFVEQNITELQISVNHVVLVHVLYSLANLMKVALNLYLMKSLPFF